MRCALPLAFALVWVCTATAAQTARLEGVVADASGARIPNTPVEAIQVGTSFTWSTFTDEAGAFSIPALPPGDFHVEVRRTGFKTSVTEGLRLEPGRAARVDVVLAPADLAESIEVRQAPASEPHATGVDLGVSLGSVEAERLPANGRNYLSLLLLAAGVTATNPQSFTVGQRMTSGGRPYVNGNRKETTSYLLDGVDVNQTTDNMVAYLPSPDALESVAITTSAASAEWGNYLGGIVTTRLKSGTNQWHGSAVYLFRDDAMNATNWAANWQPVDPLNPTRKAPMTHRTFGGTGGGPLVRDRFFFFGDYQGVRRRVGPTNGLMTMATPAMRDGDFSALLNGSNPQQLFDPLTTRPDPASPGRYLRDPFPGNRIPRERFNGVAAALFAHPLYVTPDLPGTVRNKTSRSTSNLQSDQGDVKLDARLSSAHMLSGRVSFGVQETWAAFDPVIVPGSSTRAPVRTGGARLTSQGGSAWANEVVVGLSEADLRLSGDNDGEAVGALAQAIGISGANARRMGLPAIGFSGAVSTVGSSGVVQRTDAWTLQVQDTVTWSRDRHTWKAGGLVLRGRQDSYFSGNNGQVGVIEFNGQYTRDLSDPRSTGSPLADFVLGYPSRTARGDIAEPWQHQSTLYAGFVQTDWRVSPELTLNLGLRYEYRTPLVEAEDRQVTYDLSTGSARFAGRDGNSRALYEAYPHDWQPRVGGAWAPGRFDGKGVLRAAYGLSSFQEGTGTNLRLPLNPPYFNELELVNRDPAVLGLSIDRGFDGVRERDALTGSVLRALAPDFRPARSHQWHVTGEAAIGSFLVSMGYVGQVGNHLAVPINANQAATRDGPRPLDPYLPQIGSVILTSSIGTQRYDSLQTAVRKTYSGGWSLVATHTWGHAFSDSRGYFSDSGQSAEPATFWPNPRDQEAEWGSSAFDARHHVTAGWTLDLPWGRDRRWGATMPGWANALAGGWSLDGLWRAHTGFAITVLAPDVSQTSARSGRPDLVGDVDGPEVVGPNGTWFNTDAFVLPQLGTFGNAGTGIVRGPGLNVVDAGLSKRFGLPGSSRLEVRVEAYNVFNTPVFNAPDRQFGSATFGQVLSSQLEREVQVGLRWVF